MLKRVEFVVMFDTFSNIIKSKLFKSLIWFTRHYFFYNLDVQLIFLVIQYKQSYNSLVSRWTWDGNVISVEFSYIYFTKYSCFRKYVLVYPTVVCVTWLSRWYYPMWYIVLCHCRAELLDLFGLRFPSNIMF